VFAGTIAEQDRVTTIGHDSRWVWGPWITRWGISNRTSNRMGEPMLKIGMEAPDFESADETGRPFRLSRDGGSRGTIICFYPGDFTPICTREICRLDALRLELADRGWVLVGVSPDPGARHELFKQRYGLSLRLLCDEKRLLFCLYGCLLPVIQWPLRVSWVVDTNRRIEARVHAEFRIRHHEKLLERLLGN